MTSPRRIVILGAGGQARDTAWLIDTLASNDQPWDVLGFVVSDMTKLGERDSRERVLGDLNWLERHVREVDAVALGIGTPSARLRLGREVQAAFPRLDWPVLVHPTATFDRRSARLEAGSMIAAGALGSVNLVVEPFGLINVGVTLGHEAVIGCGSVVNHAASISGGVTLGEGVLVGTGARVLQYLDIGAGATVGAGAVVTKSVGPGDVVVGVPARPLNKERA